MFQLTQHAQSRIQQRGLSPDEVDYIINHGKIFYRAGAVFYYLRDKDIPGQDRNEKGISRLAGTAVVATQEKTVITVWRKRDKGLKQIKCKPAHNVYA